MKDQYVPSNSLNNVTYSCECDSESNIVWEVDMSQIRNQRQFEETKAIGIFIEPDNIASNFSTIYISHKTRMMKSSIMIRCIEAKGIFTTEGIPYKVIIFGKRPCMILPYKIFISSNLKIKRQYTYSLIAYRCMCMCDVCYTIIAIYHAFKLSRLIIIIYKEGAHLFTGLGRYTV